MDGADPRIPVLLELQERLRFLLARLSASGIGAAGLHRARERCAESLARFQRLDGELGSASAQDLERIHAALGEAVLLNAIAAHLAKREARAVEEALDNVARSRRRVTGGGGESATGVSCDVAC